MANDEIEISETQAAWIRANITVGSDGRFMFGDVHAQCEGDLHTALACLLRGGDHRAYLIEDECIRNFSVEKRSIKKWVAVVKPNRNAPGGLERTFLERASGNWVKLGDVKAGDVLEFAADTAKYHDRVYRRVAGRHGNLLLCDECTTRGELKEIVQTVRIVPDEAPAPVPVVQPTLTEALDDACDRILEARMVDRADDRRACIESAISALEKALEALK